MTFGAYNKYIAILKHPFSVDVSVAQLVASMSGVVLHCITMDEPIFMLYSRFNLILR